MYKFWRNYNITVSRGEARTLQGDGSNVSLHIPKGSPGVFMTSVHTDLSRFQGAVPPDECIVGPIVEVTHAKLNHTQLGELPFSFYYCHN